MDVNERQKTIGLRFGCMVLLASFLIRIYGYLWGTPNAYVFETTTLGVAVFLLLAFFKMYRLKNIAYHPFLNAAALFWIWSCISSVVNMQGISNLIYQLIMQSFWFFFFLFFTYYSGRLYPKDLFFINRFCIAALLAIGIVYIYWIFSDGNVYVSGARNSVYYCLLLLPILFIQRNKAVIVSSVVVSFVAIILSGKRAAFIALVLALLIPVFFFTDKKKRGIKQILALILLIVVLIAAYYYVTSVYEITLFERLGMLTEDGGSGRLEIYKSVLEGFGESSFFQKLFGHGYNGVASDAVIVKVNGWDTSLTATSAHNDFLEVLYDYGILGLILYIAMIIRMFRFAIRLKKIDFHYFRMYLSAMIIFLTMSMVSHLIIYPTYIAFLLMFFSIGSSVVMKKEGTA